MPIPQNLPHDRNRAGSTRLTGALRLEGRRMLVVEDDVELEPLVQRAVESLNPPLQLDWCRTVPLAYGYLTREYYDLILVDYLLEGSRAGITLRSACWELQPQAIFAMTSSYPLNDYLHSVGRAGTPFLPKPFGARQLRGFVRNLLDADNSDPARGVWS